MRAALSALALGACGPRLADVDEGEWLPGDVATNTLLLGGNAFLRPAANLTAEHEGEFYGGNSFFNDSWVEAPASTANRDGLGPLFNARSCSGCHGRDGRAAPPEGEGPFGGLLLRISGPDGGPDPSYGGQLQDLALPGVPPEFRGTARWIPEPGTFADGAPFELVRPEFDLGALAYGPLAPGAAISARIAPQMIGLGLLEAIPEADLEARADAEDADGDGVRGRPQRAKDAETGEAMLGRFGWKGEAPTVRHQSAGAFLGDLGITSSIFPDGECMPGQVACAESPSGGDPELEDHLLDRVVLYSRAVAVPVRERWDDPEVLRGKLLFGRVGCDVCHTPSHVTGPFPPIPEFEGLTLWPYTDLLLHDLGEGLADGRPVGEAGPRDWKTPPLWGLGRVPDVNGHSRYLHDGRARSLEEAVLWHGGEAEASREGYVRLDAADRAALIAFLEDL